MPKSLLNPLILPKQTDHRKKGQRMPTSSTHASMDNPPQQLSSSHVNLPYLTFLNSRSRPRNSTFRIEKRKEKESSKPTPNDSERLEDALNRTRITLTNSETFSTSPNHPLRYGLCLKICLPARYLLTMQTKLGNYDGDAFKIGLSPNRLLCPLFRLKLTTRT
jgi:hypothetical protein